MNAPTPIVAFAAPASDSGDEYVAVEGVDAETVKLKRQYEAQVENKVASDYAHIILAYSAIWVIFVGYGIFLWVKHQRLRADFDELRRRTGSKGPDA